MARIIYYYHYLFVLVLLIITPLLPSAIADDTKTYIVTLKEECDVDAHYEWVKNEHMKTTVRMNTEAVKTADLKEVLKTFSIGSTNGYVAELPESWVTNVLAKRSDVESVDIDGKMHFLTPVENKSKTRLIHVKNPQKNLDMTDTNAKPLFDKSYSYPKSAGKGVNVYVVDSGIRVTHVEFEGRAKMVKVTCAGCPNTDDLGHGSHVAGIIGGRTVGVSKKVSLFGVKIGGPSGVIVSDILEGLQFVSDEKKAKKSKIFVINMSLGGPLDKSLNNAVKGLTDQGIHVFVAAGNEYTDACTESPSSAKSAITVGAIQDTSLTISEYSNYGPCVDIFAPGDNVRSCGISNDKAYVEESGTSMASPHAAGVAALILGEKGDMPPAKLAAFMKKMALAGKITFTPGKGTDVGSPNLFASIKKMF